MNPDAEHGRPICVIGDIHGHLQLALCVAARWQRELAVCFDGVFLCGDVGAFTADAQLDSTTRRHGKANPCELEFLRQWAVDPQPSWLGHIFQPEERDGLGLVCPVVMVHGNHEGFAHLATLSPKMIPNSPVGIGSLPTVDRGAHVRYLPSGWRCVTSGGVVVGGVGGIERGQRHADYHAMACIDVGPGPASGVRQAPLFFDGSRRATAIAVIAVQTPRLPRRGRPGGRDCPRSCLGSLMQPCLGTHHDEMILAMNGARGLTSAC